MKLRTILGALLLSLSNQNHADPLPIVTIDSPLGYILQMETEEIQLDELPLAQEIVNQLFASLEPNLPAAGLAAPQIGISRSVFIYSFDRDPKHLEPVINPSFVPLGDERVIGWEGCFSGKLANGTCKFAKLPRYESIKVQYLNLKGEKVEKVLEGFGAKVFQHEYDHLKGITCVAREDAEIKDFSSEEEAYSFLQQVKKEDSLRYKKPEA